MLAVEHLVEEDTVRVVAALALVVANTAVVLVAVSPPAEAGIYPPPVSDCVTVTVSPPADIRPQVTVCQP